MFSGDLSFQILASFVW